MPKRSPPSRERAAITMREAQRWQTIAQVSDTLIWTTNAHSPFLSLTGFISFASVTTPHPQADDWLLIAHPADRDQIRELFRSLRLTPQPFDITVRLRHADGDFRVMRVRGAPVLTPAGRVREWVGTARDCTDEVFGQRIAAFQLAIQRSLAALVDEDTVLEQIAGRLRDLFTDAHVTLTVVDLSTRRLRLRVATDRAAPSLDAIIASPIEEQASPCASAFITSELTGASDLTGETRWPAFRAAALAHGARAAWATPIHATTAGRLGALMVTLATPRALAPLEHQAIAAAAQLTTLTIEALCRRELATSARDASVRHAARFQAALAAMTDGVVIYDANGAIQEVNRGFLAMLDVPPDISLPDLSTFLRDVSVRREDGSLHPDPTSWSRRLLAGEVFDGDHAQLIHTHYPDGRDRVYSVTGAPIRDSASVITGAVTVTRDVTALRQMEETQERFFAMVGHELRAPLQPILLASQRIQRLAGQTEQPDLGARLARLSDDIVRYALHMNRLVADLLSYRGITMGRFTVALAPCDIASITRQAVLTMAQSFKREIHLIGVEAPIIARADQERLWQLITNLTRNACVHAATARAITVAIDRGERALHLRVTDDGPGIDPAALPHLFEHFYQAPSAARRDGLGLGLAIAQSIAQAHGGKITVRSALGRGTTFTLHLPIQPVALADTPKELAQNG